MVRTHNMFKKAFENGNDGKNVNIIAFDLKHKSKLFQKGIEVLKTCSFSDTVRIVPDNYSFEFVTSNVSPYIDLNNVMVKVLEMRTFDWDQWKVRGYSKDTIHYVDPLTLEQKFAKLFGELRRFYD